MKLLTFAGQDGPPRVGALVEGNRVIDVAAAAAARGVPDREGAAFASMLALIEAGEEALALARELVAAPGDAASHNLLALRLLAPLPVPQQLRDCLVFERHLIQASAQHAKLITRDAPDPDAALRDLLASGAFAIPEVWYQQPIYYKGNRFSVIGPDQDIEWPSYSQRLDYELEMAAVIGRTAKNIARDRAHEHIFGYTIYNDVSARDAQFKELPGRLGPAKGKDFDTGNVMGPWIVTADEIDPYDQTMIAWVNGQETSRGHSGDMHHRFDRILEHISMDETLHAGEVIGSGTVGNGCGAEFDRWLKPGDVIEFEISSIGRLRNRIVKPGEER